MEADSAQSRLKCDAENCAYLVTCSYLWGRTTTTVQASQMERTCTLHDPLKRLATYRSYTRYPHTPRARCSNAPGDQAMEVDARIWQEPVKRQQY